MKYIRHFLFLLTLAAIAAGPVAAGRLAPDLVQAANGKASDEKMRVWIKLVPVIDAARFKAAVHASSASRTGRYGFALSRLKSDHADAQRNLLSHMQSLKSADVSNIKPHWLVNVIEADVAVGKLGALASRDDVELILQQPTVQSIMPDETSSLSQSIAGVESNLTYINAPSAWAAGYTGRGRVVCIFDTGVDGLHPALFDNWKGHDGNSAAAWFDPKEGESFPHVITDCGLLDCRPTHGTHVTGIVVGHDDASGDTVGVALDAKWIAAAAIDIAGVSIIDAFEWAADPDGDPNSMGDVPDVINHSWGVADIGCQNVFYDMIDATEALGIVNIFSAGNDGSNFTTMTIRNPANRAIDSLDCFAVGNLDHNTETLVSSSSRGPSDCNFIGIKPNVVAPGLAIRSTGPNNTYFSQSGTSMAAPHVAGLVALLRQKNPNATVDEVKEAILTTARDLGQSLPNNDYGWGAIDCMAALNALSSTNDSPNVRVYAFDHDPISPGDTVSGSLVLKNLGADLSNVSANVLNPDPSLTVLDGYGVFGDIDEGDTVRSSDIFRVIVSDTVTPGSILSADLLVTNSTGYNSALQLYFMVEPDRSRSFVTLDAGNIDFSVSNFGTLGLGDGSIFPAGGVGFIHRDGENEVNDLWDAGLMIGRDASHVSDGVSNVAAEPDGDFQISADGNIAFVTPLAPSSQQARCKFNDERAENPIGVSIVQNSYAFDSSPYQDVVVLQYFITNRSGTSLTSLHVGLHLDWDIVSFGSNSGGYDSGLDYLWMAYRDSEGGLSNYRGVKVVDGTTFTAYTDSAASVVYVPNGYDDDGYTELEKMNSLAKGIDSPSEYQTVRTDLFQVMACRITLEAGATDTIAFAVMAGSNLSAFSAAATAAQTAYDLILTANVPPEITPIADFSVDAGEDISLVVTAVDPNATIPSLRAVNLPDGSSFVDDADGSGRFSWPGSSQQEGQYEVLFIAEDASLADTESVVMTIVEVVPPVSYILYQNFPNPFNNGTVFRFYLSQPRDYTIDIFNMAGQKVSELSGRDALGEVFLPFDGRTLASGVYLYRLTIGNFTTSRKMVLVR